MEIFENNFSLFLFRSPLITPLLTVTTLLLGFLLGTPSLPGAIPFVVYHFRFVYLPLMITSRLSPFHLAPPTFASVYLLTCLLHLHICTFTFVTARIRTGTDLHRTTTCASGTSTMSFQPGIEPTTCDTVYHTTTSASWACFKLHLRPFQLCKLDFFFFQRFELGISGIIVWHTTN